MNRDPDARKDRGEAAPDDIPHRSTFSKGVTLRLGAAPENRTRRWSYEHVCGISCDARGNTVGYVHSFRGGKCAGGPLVRFTDSEHVGFISPHVYHHKT